MTCCSPYTHRDASPTHVLKVVNCFKEKYQETQHYNKDLWKIFQQMLTVEAKLTYKNLLMLKQLLSST